ncbi:MAG TPA: YIP1 family protein [Bacillota bacterium]|nr:YIP1 family protein [Bacillota bacterium]
MSELGVNQNPEVPEQTVARQEISFWQRIWGVIVNPGETLRVVAENPTIVWPLVFMALGNLVGFLITLPKLRGFLVFTFEQMPKEQYTAEQIAAIKNYMAGSTAVLSSGIAVILMPLIIWLVYVLIFKFANLFIGNEAPFKKLYAVAILTYVPTLLGNLLRSLLVLVSPAENFGTVTTSAALLMPKGSTGPLFVALTRLDPFYIWSLWLLAIGAAYVLKTTTKKTGLIVFALFFISLVVMAALATLNPQAAGA